MSNKLSDSNPVVYDPNPIDIELKAWEKIGLENLQLSELCKPEVVQLLIHNFRITLSKQKTIESKLMNQQNENTSLKDEREALRIEIATLKEKERTTWLEIPISILSGFAINMLTTNFKSDIGWVLLILSLLMLVLLRFKNLLKNRIKLYRLRQNKWRRKI